MGADSRIATANALVGRYGDGGSDAMTTYSEILAKKKAELPSLPNDKRWKLVFSGAESHAMAKALELETQSNQVAMIFMDGNPEDQGLVYIKAPTRM